LPVAVNTSINGAEAETASIKAVQTFLSQTVNLQLDDQRRAAAVIALQGVLVGLGKFSAGSVNKSIDKEMLGAKIIAVQTAANLP
jgi:hypothetical protein